MKMCSFRITASAFALSMSAALACIGCLAGAAGESDQVAGERIGQDQAAWAEETSGCGAQCPSEAPPVETAAPPPPPPEQPNPPEIPYAPPPVVPAVPVAPALPVGVPVAVPVPVCVTPPFYFPYPIAIAVGNRLVSLFFPCPALD